MADSRLRESVLLRALIVVIIMFSLFIPIYQITSLVEEREQRFGQAVDSIAADWGKSQTIAGPLLCVPVEKTIIDKDGHEEIVHTMLHIAPDSLTVNGSITTERRYRGIYEATIYRAPMTISGYFDLSRIPDPGSEARLHWNDASFLLGVTDLKGINSGVKMNINGEDFSPQAGSKISETLPSGLQFASRIDPMMSRYSFRCTIDVKGSTELQISPVGKSTHIVISSPWPDPIFSGAFLPESRAMSSQGFNAQWNIGSLNSNIPHWWVGGQPGVLLAAVGVRLAPAVTEYQMVLRVVKYAFLTILLTFVTVFLSEVLAKELMHPVHYTLIGFALLLFYLLVLAFSEHVGFSIAYWIAASVTVLLIFFYMRGIARRPHTPSVVAGLIMSLDVFLYILFQAEDYAILAGSLALLFVLTMVMLLTRSVDWFALGGRNELPTM